MGLLLLPFTVAVFVAGVSAAIGPVTDLHIVNKDLTPDGFQRPTVLAEGVFPGPLIKGNKVTSIFHPFSCSIFSDHHDAGRQFPIECHRPTCRRPYVNRHIYCTSSHLRPDYVH